MGKSASIPSTQGLDARTKRVLDPLIEKVETMSGRRTAKLPQLPANATLAEAIAAYNALLDRMQE